MASWCAEYLEYLAKSNACWGCTDNYIGISSFVRWWNRRLCSRLRAEVAWVIDSNKKFANSLVVIGLY